jgi:hypothetical protein
MFAKFIWRIHDRISYEPRPLTESCNDDLVPLIVIGIEPMNRRAPPDIGSILPIRPQINNNISPPGG